MNERDIAHRAVCGIFYRHILHQNAFARDHLNIFARSSARASFFRDMRVLRANIFSARVQRVWFAQRAAWFLVIVCRTSFARCARGVILSFTARCALHYSATFIASSARRTRIVAALDCCSVVLAVSLLNVVHIKIAGDIKRTVFARAATIFCAYFARDALLGDIVRATNANKRAHLRAHRIDAASSTSSLCAHICATSSHHRGAASASSRRSFGFIVINAQLRYLCLILRLGALVCIFITGIAHSSIISLRTACAASYHGICRASCAASFAPHAAVPRISRAAQHRHRALFQHSAGMDVCVIFCS